MSAEERKQRFWAMKEKVREYDAEWWLHNFFKEWEKH